MQDIRGMSVPKVDTQNIAIVGTKTKMNPGTLIFVD